MTNELPELIGEGLTVLFCGINPGLTAATAGHHFVNRSNRFWRVLHLAGFTPREIAPEQDRTILDYGYGLTTVVSRPTARADQLSTQEFNAAAAQFSRKVAHLAPRIVAFLGKPAYAALSAQRHVAWGRQTARMEGAIVWVLPNPSGLNAHETIDSLARAYRQAWDAANAY